MGSLLQEPVVSSALGPALLFISAATVDAECTLVYVTEDSCVSQACFLCPEQRPEWSLVGQCAERSLLGSCNWAFRKLCI